eukprot:854425-Amphidinium_carterae.2
MSVIGRRHQSGQDRPNSDLLQNTGCRPDCRSKNNSEAHNTSTQDNSFVPFVLVDSDKRP